jgi:hypothetical protein
MEMAVLFVGAIMLSIPVMVVVALVRSGKTRDLLEQSNAEHRRELEWLRSDLEQLHRDFAQLAKGTVERAAPSPPAPSPAAVETSAPSVAVTVPALTPAPAASIDTPSVRSVPVAPIAPVLPPPAFARSVSEKVEAPRAVHGPVTTPSSKPEPVRAGDAAPTTEQNPIPRAERPPHEIPTPPQAPPAFAAVAPRKSLAERLRGKLPLEEVLGMNVFAKIGIVLLVLGFALLGRMALISMGPAARVGLIYAVSAALLGGGIWLETRDRYRLLGRAGIGGGWALLFFTTYAMHNVSAMAVLESNTLDCVLMLLVAAGMVGHTLRYKSQVVTGLAFLLAFSTVALSQDSVYALSAGVILAIAIVAIALRMRWYELEVFGILASYANHFYWLYKLYPEGMSGRAFAQFWPSAIILVLYWAVFRVSYVARSIRGPRDESVSSAAALVNTISLLAVMKFQSTRPELAFYALLGLGALEFAFGQIAPVRRRRTAFKLLTLVGTVLMFAAVPFKFSGNSIALFWMIAAEFLLAAGIIQPEVVFRRLGLIAGSLTGALILFDARGTVELRQHSEAPLIQDGILLLTTALLFCVNAHFLRCKWSRLFEGIDGALAIVEGYLGAATAFFGAWALFTGDWTALGWAALFLLAVFGKRRLNDNQLMVQAWALAAAVLFRCEVVNCHFGVVYPHHVAARMITLPILAGVFYFAGWLLSGRKDMRVPLRVLSLWAGSLLLAELAWLDVSQPSVAPVWVAFAVALVLVARRFSIAEFSYQEHVLVAAAVAQLAAVNLDAAPAIDRYLPFVGCAAAFYAISRFSTLKLAAYLRFSGWAHTWAATGLLASLAWHESPQPWLVPIWAGFALVLAMVDRVFSVEELPYQAHLLALLSVLRAVTLNFYLHETWRGMDLRLVTVAILIAVLYTLARWVRLPESLANAHARHVYTWITSGLAAWLMWCELRSVTVALAWAVFGLLLFELGAWKNQVHLRWQAFVALAAAFVRIFFVNVTAEVQPGEALSPRLYTIVPMALIYFYIWTRLLPKKAEACDRWSMADVIAYFGTGSIAAVLYFEITPEWIIVGWAILCVVLLLAALLLDRDVFLQHAHLLAAAIVARSLAHNIFCASYFLAVGWKGKFYVFSIAVVVLLAGLAIALTLRARYASRALSRFNRLLLLKYPHQVFFFSPVVLVTVMIAVKMNPGMVTLSWGIVGVLVILLGLLAAQRSYRLTGLFLLLLCVGKIVVRDAWLLSERDRYTTFIVLGAALTLVSMLYGRYREAVRRLL